MAKDEIDFGNEYGKELPLVGRKSVSLLLGAGFSAPMGYPIGKEMNDRLLNFDDDALVFSTTGGLATSIDGKKPATLVEEHHNNHQKYFMFCKRLIKEYSIAHGNQFDYEKFYDFIKTNESKQSRYQSVCADLLSESECYDQCLANIFHIYNQMVIHLLKDKLGKSWYDDEPFGGNFFDDYNGFLIFLSKLSQEYIINVHTLNHDLLFESFNNTEFLNGTISDGFSEYGSEYFGKLLHENRYYLCRLERYTGRYNTSIRLFKLHGSLDYVPFYRTSNNGFMILEKYVKIKWGIGASDIQRGRKSKIGYDISPFEYHTDVLTGTISKIQRYKELLLFRKLFKTFRKNLRNAEKLIIIGYGCKDVGINEIIKDNFDFKHKPLFIVDAYAKEGSQVELFREELHAKLHRVQIGDIDKALFV